MPNSPTLEVLALEMAEWATDQAKIDAEIRVAQKHLHEAERRFTAAMNRSKANQAVKASLDMALLTRARELRDNG